MEFIKEKEQQKIKASKSKDKKKNLIFCNPDYIKLESKLHNEFIQFFSKIHKFIIPISKKEFTQLVTETGVKNVTYNEDTGLSSNTCLAKDCFHRGKKIKKIHHHFDIMASYPKGFHLFVKNNLKENEEKLFDLFIDHFHLNKSQNSFYGYTKDEVLQYLKMVKEAYQNMKD